MAQPMNVDPVSAGGGSDKPRANVQAPKDFDLDSYIAMYTGHMRYHRLIFISTCCKELELESLKRAIDELKKTANTTLYKEVIDRVGDRLGPTYALDRAWIDSTDKRAAAVSERLENELTGSKANLVKEAIRAGHNDLGDFYYDRGDLQSALKSYVRTRDYCQNSKQVIQMCLNVIKVSVELNNYTHVANYTAKAEQLPDLDAGVAAKLKVVSGLAQLDARKYKMAARKWLDIPPELGSQFSDVVSAQDLALYTGLCALASFDRQELKKKVLDNQPFKNYLDLVPDVRALLSDFHASRYNTCLDQLAKLKPYLELDLFFAPHVTQLYEKIRSKALIQYFSPYSSVNLNTMADAFKTTVPLLEKELSRLIMEGLISARIDSHSKVLYARQADQRTVAFDRALALGDEYHRTSRAAMLRVNMLRHEFFVRPPRSEDDRDREREREGKKL